MLPVARRSPLITHDSRLTTHYSDDAAHAACHKLLMPRSPTPHPALLVARHPLRFVWRVLKRFRANQGVLLSGAVAYYTLLSIVPLFTLLLVVLSRIVDEHLLLDSIARYLSLIVPGETAYVLAQIAGFLEHREVAGWVMFAVLLFFSSIAFTVLENAMSIIFAHRVSARRRHFLSSALIPYVYIFLLGCGLLLTSLVAGFLEALAANQLALFGRTWSLDWLSVGLLYCIGLAGEILMLASIYMVMPVGRLSWRHALIGGATAALLWELTRHVVVWYFANLSLVGVVYGSLATTIVALLSLEIAGMILLLGAQVIAEYERLSLGEPL